MDYPVRPSIEKFRQVYELGFRTWAHLYSKAINSPGLPEFCFDPFPQHPHFPPNLKPKHVQYAKHSCVYATGSTTWDSPQDACPHGLPAFQQDFELPVGAREPIPLSASDESGEAPGYAPWFSNGDMGYFPVLVLAWAYILSARWTDVMPGPCSLTYTGTLAPSSDQCAGQPQMCRDPLVVDIGDAEVEEARWWAAVLAPGLGWEASMLVGADKFLSPWSVTLQMPRPFLLSKTLPLYLASPPCAPACFSNTRWWLHKFCVRHHILDQAHAALFSVVLLPSLGSGKPMQLPAFKAGKSSQPALEATSDPLDDRWPYHDERQLDRLLTLSCNTRGIRPLLLSIF